MLPFLMELETINKDKGNKMDTAAIKSELVRHNSEKKSWLTKSISDLRLPFQRDRLNRVVDESSLNSINVGQSLDQSMSLQSLHAFGAQQRQKGRNLLFDPADLTAMHSSEEERVRNQRSLPAHAPTSNFNEHLPYGTEPLHRNRGDEPFIG